MATYEVEEYIPVTAGLKEVGALPLAFHSQGCSPRSIKVLNLPLDFVGQGFFLDNVLTSDECQAVIAIGEKLGFGPVESDCRKECSARKVMMRWKALADELWSRLLPFVEEIEIKASCNIHRLHLEGNSFAMQGKWRPVKLDTTFRLSSYEGDACFTRHFDGFYADEENPTCVRSMKTVVVYLSEPTSGGGTAFLSEQSETREPICVVNPKAGRCLIFNHRSLHEGLPVSEGECTPKYILRSDVMYQRLDTGLLSESDQMAIDLVNQAEQLEMEHRTDAAAELYRRAFKMSPALADSYANKDD